MFADCRHNSLLDAFFRRFQQFFRTPENFVEPGWYSLADVARMLGYPSCKAAKTALPESDIGFRGRGVSVAGIAILALKATKAGVVERVRALCVTVLTDLLTPQPENPEGGLSALCSEIRAVLDRYSQKSSCDFSMPDIEELFSGTLTRQRSAPDACYNAFSL